MNSLHVLTIEIDGISYPINEKITFNFDNGEYKRWAKPDTLYNIFTEREATFAMIDEAMKSA